MRDRTADPPAEPKPDPKLDRSRDVSRLTKHSYLAGLAGTVAVMGMGYLASKREVLTKGWGLKQGPLDTNQSMIFVLLVVSAVMFLVELAIRLDVDRGRFIKLAPEIKARDYPRFLGRCLLIYGVELGVLSLVIAFYQTANEYGFRAGGQGYYRPWFVVMETFRTIYLYGGLPYVLLTRALQHSASSDRKQAAFTVIKLARLAWARAMDRAVAAAADDEEEDDGEIERRAGAAGEDEADEGAERAAAPAKKPAPREPLRSGPAPFDRYDKSALLGLGVKIFFVPLMTVFFCDQFLHLVKNYDWMLGRDFRLANVTLRDVHNVSHSVIFAVDVGLAWCGYVVSSRWIKNTIFSAEPTWEGWSVALLCYPPINHIPGYYYGTPGEDAFFAIPNQGVVTFFCLCSILSFTVYTSATVMFGLRFSNLTHRGIIATGPYALVRHPAYASKNFSWWCVMLPFALYQMWIAPPETRWAPVLQIIGMVVMSGIYYRRAITEEQHLSRDPEYRLYMKKVPYRFIPGVL